MDIIRGLFGMLVLLGIAWLFSVNRRAINWPLVAKGLLIQVILGLLILKVPFIELTFEYIGKVFIKVIDMTKAGVRFLFQSYDTGEVEPAIVSFAFNVLPVIVFFSALTSLFYYLGLLQKVIQAIAWLMRKLMKISGAESMVVAGNIFLGQTESPLLVRPYLGKMTRSELMTLMTGGMATIAGSVLSAFISHLGGESEAEQLLFAKHLIVASVMSAPAAIVAAKMLVPETEKFNENFEVPKEKIGANALEAIVNGTTEGIKLAVNVAGMLLVFVSLIALVNFILLKVGYWTDLNSFIADNSQYEELSFEMIMGYIFAPVAWIIGVESADIFLVGQLLGEKTVLNEFLAYESLGALKSEGQFSSQKSIIIATYVLCGFSNISSIGIQIGGIGSLIPNRKGLLSKLGVRALIGGTLACLFTACIVGMLL